MPLGMEINLTHIFITSFAQYNVIGETLNNGFGVRLATKPLNVLLNRLGKYNHNHLLILHNFSVMFDDNISERDLRKGEEPPENG